MQGSVKRVKESEQVNSAAIYPVFSDYDAGEIAGYRVVLENGIFREFPNHWAAAAWARFMIRDLVTYTARDRKLMN